MSARQDTRRHCSLEICEVTTLKRRAPSPWSDPIAHSGSRVVLPSIGIGTVKVDERPAEGPMPQATFYFDLGSPYAYLMAERLPAVLDEPVEWQPVALGALFKLSGRSSWSLGDQHRRQEGMAEVERRARDY